MVNEDKLPLHYLREELFGLYYHGYMCGHVLVKREYRSVGSYILSPLSQVEKGKNNSKTVLWSWSY